MFRSILLCALATATLAGCATGYGYRDGNGDYYYGQPRTEYRYYDPYGAYGSYGYGTYGNYGYGSGYYYDRYGRVVYGNPYGYYGSPYGYGNAWWWSHQRPAGGYGGHGDGRDDHHDDHDGDRDGRRPPWRNFGNAMPPGDRIDRDDGDMRPRARRPITSAMPAPPPPRVQRSSEPVAPRMRSDDGGGSRMGRAIRGSAPPPSSDD